MGERHSAADIKRPGRQRRGPAPGARPFAPHPSGRCGCRRKRRSRPCGDQQHHQHQQLDLHLRCCTTPRGCDARLRGHRSSQRSGAPPPRGAALAAPPPKPCSDTLLSATAAAAAEPHERCVGTRSRALAPVAPTAAASAPATTVGPCRSTGRRAASFDGCATTTAGLGRFL